MDIGRYRFYDVEWWPQKKNRFTRLFQTQYKYGQTQDKDSGRLSPVILWIVFQSVVWSEAGCYRLLCSVIHSHVESVILLFVPVVSQVNFLGRSVGLCGFKVWNDTINDLLEDNRGRSFTRDNMDEVSEQSS